MSDFEVNVSKRFALALASLLMVSVCVGILVVMTNGAWWGTASIWGMGGILCLYWLLKCTGIDHASKNRERQRHYSIQYGPLRELTGEEKNIAASAASSIHNLTPETEKT